MCGSCRLRSQQEKMLVLRSLHSSLGYQILMTYRITIICISHSPLRSPLHSPCHVFNFRASTLHSLSCISVRQIFKSAFIHLRICDLVGERPPSRRWPNTFANSFTMGIIKARKTAAQSEHSSLLSINSPPKNATSATTNAPRYLY